MQAKPKFVCRSWCLFMYTCPHCDRVIFQSNLSMAVGLSLQRLAHVDVQQHKLAPRKKVKVSQLIGRTGKHLPTERAGWRSIPRTGPPWAHAEAIRRKAGMLLAGATPGGCMSRCHIPCAAFAHAPRHSQHLSISRFWFLRSRVWPWHAALTLAQSYFKIQCMRFRRLLNWG